PQSLYRFALSTHGPAAVLNGIRADADGVDFIDASVGPDDVTRIVASPSKTMIKIPIDLLQNKYPFRSPIPLLLYTVGFEKAGFRNLLHSICRTVFSGLFPPFSNDTDSANLE